MKIGFVLIAVGGALFMGAGCGGTGISGGESTSKLRTNELAAHRRARHQHRIDIRRQQAREAKARRLVQFDARQQRQAERAEEAAPEGGECDPNYTGACLDPNASDYDCEGGSGNGPDYTGEVTVVGVDHYDLDADGDGIGCESE